MQIVLFIYLYNLGYYEEGGTGVGGWATGNENLTGNGKRARVVEKRKKWDNTGNG